LLGPMQSRDVPPATFGKAVTKDYHTTFIEAYPDLDGTVWVHHAVPKQALKRYPGAMMEEELHSFENLRGIPLDRNRDLHLSKIAIAWNGFYRTHAVASKQDLLDFATEIDTRYGHLFNPPR
jgi:hypothetical protein